MDHFLPFIIFSVFVVMKVLKAVKNARDESGPSGSPQDTDVARARRFREALGLPPDAQAPPPPVRRRIASTPAPLLPVNPPRPLVPGQLRRSRDPAEPKVVLKVPPLILPEPQQVVTYAPAPEPAPVPPPMPAPVEAHAVSAAHLRGMAAVERAYRQGPTGAARGDGRALGILKLLRSHGSARNAMILREVLGPPKALA